MLATGPRLSRPPRFGDMLGIYICSVFLFQAVQGLCISIVMKHSSNITRLVLTCASLVVSASMSILLFDLQVTGYFIISASMIIIALVLYNRASLPPTTTKILSLQDMMSLFSVVRIFQRIWFILCFHKLICNVIECVVHHVPFCCANRIILFYY